MPFKSSQFFEATIPPLGIYLKHVLNIFTMPMFIKQCKYLATKDYLNTFHHSPILLMKVQPLKVKTPENTKLSSEY